MSSLRTAVPVIVMTTFGIIRAVEEANCGIDIWAADTGEFVCQVDL